MQRPQRLRVVNGCFPAYFFKSYGQVLPYPGRRAPQRLRQAESEGAGVVEAEFGWGAAEVGGGGCGDAVEAGTGLYDIEVDFEDALLAPESFYQNCPPGFKGLAEPSLGAESEQVAGSLLGDGAASAQRSVHVFMSVPHSPYFFPVEAVVGVEPCVLGCDDRTDKGGREVLKRCPLVPMSGESLVVPKLDVSAEHERCPSYPPVSEGQYQNEASQHEGGRKPY